MRWTRTTCARCWPPGVSRQQIEDALAVCFAFNTTDRLADTFEFFVPGHKAFEAGARFLLARGYR